MKINEMIWITDNKKYLDQLKPLTTLLEIDDLVLDKECDIEKLPYYKLVVFLINPTNAANRFFIKGIESILKVRKSSKTIMFIINDVHTLTTEEVVNLKMELVKSLNSFISNPIIQVCSTYYANLYNSYRLGEKKIDDIRKENNLVIPLEDGTYLTGRDVNQEHLEKVYDISNMDNLISLIRLYLNNIEQTNIDVTKRNMLVVGPKEVNKKLLVEIANKLMHQDVLLSEQDSLNGIDIELFDKVIVAVDLDFARHCNYVEEICSKYTDSNILFIVDKVDEYMLYGRSREEIIKLIKKEFKQLTRNPICFISSYYINSFQKLEENIISIEEIIEDSNIVFEDILGFPLVKRKNRKLLPELLTENGGYYNLLKYLEG